MPSRREIIRMTDDEVHEYLQGRHTINMATMGADERIHLVAMWYAFLDGEIAIATFAKSQKVANLRRDPRITLLVETGDDYDQLRGVEIVGTATVHDDEETVLTVATGLVQRYYPVGSEAEARDLATIMAAKRAVITVRPDKVVSWDHTKLAGVY